MAAGAGDQQIMLDEQRMYKMRKKLMRKKLDMGMGKTIALVKMVKDIMTVVQFHLKKELDTERNPVFDHSYHTGVSGVTGLL